MEPAAPRYETQPRTDDLLLRLNSDPKNWLEKPRVLGNSLSVFERGSILFDALRKLRYPLLLPFSNQFFPSTLPL